MSVLISESKIRKIVRNEIKRLVSESADTSVHIPNIGEVTLEYDSTDDKVWRIDFNQMQLCLTLMVTMHMQMKQEWILPASHGSLGGF